MTRRPVVAGQFYERFSNDLDKQIDNCFLSRFGPGKLPLKKRIKETVGVISPHAGYQFSGPCAAFSYKEIAESRFPDLFIMLGLSHSGYGSSVSLEDWETPFGAVKNDKDFGKEMVNNFGLRQNEPAHQLEHSIEVQLPFLQFVNKELIDKIRICPIICSPDRDYKDIAAFIVQTIKSSKKRVVLITSSDFTHYGFNYGYSPFSRNIKENMYKLDNGAIERIRKLDAPGFLRYVEQTGATICGQYPIAVLLEACKILNVKSAQLLKYYTSGDVIGDYSSAVGYGAICMR